MERTKEEIEKKIRQLIYENDELTKVDFKYKLKAEGRADSADMAKLVSAMANSDSTEHDNIGYLIFGAVRGELVGGVDMLAKDSTSADLQQKLNAFLEPPVHFETRAFRDPEKGWFGALIIYPDPLIRPHFIRRTYQGQGASVREGECYVRIGDTTQLARRHDFERIYRLKYESEIAALKKGIHDELEFIKEELLKLELEKLTRDYEAKMAARATTLNRQEEQINAEFTRQKGLYDSPAREKALEDLRHRSELDKRRLEADYEAGRRRLEVLIRGSRNIKELLDLYE